MLNSQPSSDVAPQAAGRLLGNNTESITPPLDKSRELRADRYRIQSIARMLYGREGRRAGLEHPFNFHRTAKCTHTRFHKTVGIHLSKEHKKAFYAGLVICGNVWTCPVCTAKVQERRRIEIAAGMNKAYGAGMKCIMVTLTFPHMAFDTLPDLLSKQAVALGKLRAGNPWKKIKDKAGYHGLIRSLELTHGDHGWHPHTHEIWMVDKDCDAEWLKGKIIDRWESACTRAGLLKPSKVEAFRLHAVDVKDNASCSEYLAKMDDSKHWGADREIAKASTKESKGDHPFGLLHKFDQGDEKAGALWLEYTTAIRGRAQLYWSRGLKAWAELQEKTDEELAAEQTDEADELAELTPGEWSIVLQFGARSTMLDLAETEGRLGIQRWLTEKRGLLRQRLDADQSSGADGPAYCPAVASTAEPLLIRPEAPQSLCEGRKAEIQSSASSLWSVIPESQGKNSALSRQIRQLMLL